MATESRMKEAVADVIGALCYALLRSFQVIARGTTSAPNVALAERQASFAQEELTRFRALRARLVDLTDEPEAAMERFRAPLDAFYEGAVSERWVETQVFHFVGDTLTNDFAEIIAPRVDKDTADAVRRALTGRTEQEAFALQQINEALEAEGQMAQDQIASFAGKMVGEGLNRLRDALLESDALELVLGGDDGVKEAVLELLGRHRERLERLGVDTLE
jgi:tRNA-(MS[2]IO[6]A)-hydroxylase (MiaE)-like